MTEGIANFVVPSAIGTGKTMVLAPEDPERKVKIVIEHHVA
jgi:hypothetical protein